MYIRQCTSLKPNIIVQVKTLIKLFYLEWSEFKNIRKAELNLIYFTKFTVKSTFKILQEIEIMKKTKVDYNRENKNTMFTLMVFMVKKSNLGMGEVVT